MNSEFAKEKLKQNYNSFRMTRGGNKTGTGKKSRKHKHKDYDYETSTETVVTEKGVKVKVKPGNGNSKIVNKVKAKGKGNDSGSIGSGPEPLTFREKILTSCAVWFGTFTLGLNISFLGSSLLELRLKFDTDVATISKVFTVLTCSFLVGAIVCGVLFNHVNRQLASTVLLVAMGIGTICLPLAPTIAWFFCMAAVVGFCLAGYDTAQIVWVIELWEKRAAPFIQIQHFVLAVGTFVSPLLMKPFLSNSIDAGVHSVELILLNNNNNNNYSTDIDNSTDMEQFEANRTAYAILEEEDATNFTVVSEPTVLAVDSSAVDVDIGHAVAAAASHSSVLYIPFLIGGMFSIAGGLILLAMYYVKPYVKPAKIAALQASDEDEPLNKRPKTGGLTKECNCKKALLVFLSAFMLGAYTAMEMCSIQFLPSFTHFVGLGLTARQGALVLSGLTGAFTFGRGVGILVVLKILPEILLAGNITLIIIGNSILYFFANESYLALWAGAICLGLGFSTVFPSFYGYIERHLLISNFVGACMIVGGGGVSSVYPLIIGGWMRTNPFVLMYTNYFNMVVIISAFLAIYWITKRDEAKREAIEKDGGCDGGEAGVGPEANGTKNQTYEPDTASANISEINLNYLKVVP